MTKKLLILAGFLLLVGLGFYFLYWKPMKKKEQENEVTTTEGSTTATNVKAGSFQATVAPGVIQQGEATMRLAS